MRAKQYHQRGGIRKHSYPLCKIYASNCEKQFFNHKKKGMDNKPFDITDFLTMTDFSAIKKCVYILSDSKAKHIISKNKLEEDSMRRLDDIIRNAISEISNCNDVFENNSDSLLSYFAAPSYDMIRSIRDIISLDCLADFQSNCDFLKKEWEIQEQDEDNVKKDVERCGYTNWHGHLKTLYPPKPEEELHKQVIKKILFLRWTLNWTIDIMRKFLKKETDIRANSDKCFELFKKQMADMEKQMKNSYINPEDVSNIARYANTPLVKALHGKENKDNVSKLYHYYSDDGSRDITKQTMIEYLLYEKALAYQKEMAKADQFAKNPTLVMDDAILNLQIKAIIDHLSEITTLKTKVGEPYVDNNTCASIIVLANDVRKGTDMNIHRYICLKHKAASAYGGISPKVKEIREIIKKKKSGEIVENSENYQFFCNFRDKVIRYGKKNNQQLLPNTPTSLP